MARKKARREESAENDGLPELYTDLEPYLAQCGNLEPEEVGRIVLGMLAGAERGEWVHKDAIGAALLWAEKGRSTVVFLETIGALGRNAVRLKWDPEKNELLAQLTDKGDKSASEILGHALQPPRRTRPPEN